LVVGHERLGFMTGFTTITITYKHKLVIRQTADEIISKNKPTASRSRRLLLPAQGGGGGGGGGLHRVGRCTS